MMGTRERPDFDSMRSWGSFSPESRANRWAWYVAIGIFFLLVALIVAAMFYRLSTRRQSDVEGSPAFAGHMPAGFSSDYSAEASAFRSTCARCHVLPSPSLYDEGGWRLVSRKMATHMATRGMHVPESQVELAIAYLIRHSQSRSPAGVATKQTGIP